MDGRRQRGAVAEAGLSRRFGSFWDNVQDSEHSDGGEGDVGGNTVDAVVRS